MSIDLTNVEEQLTHDQYVVFKNCIVWYNLSSDEQDDLYYIIPGFAGTGKSYIIKFITKALGLEDYQIAFATFTGAAALNLVKRGNPNASTIHKLIYDCKVNEFPVYERDKDGNIKKDDKGNDIIKEYKRVLSTIKKDSLDPLIKLIIVDEYSMLDSKMINDLLSFGIKTIFLGDFAQLPPIHGKSNLNESNFYQLSEIVRQSSDSPIINLSMMARNKKAIPYGKYGNVNILPVEKLHDDEYAAKNYLSASQIICGYNNTRKKINDLVRKYKGFTNKTPEVGDKVVCTRNDWSKVAYSPVLNSYIPLVNGQIGYVTKVSEYDPSRKIFIMEFKTDFDEECIFKVLVSGYNFDKTSSKLRDDKVKIFKQSFDNVNFNSSDLTDFRMIEETVEEFDFAYAITCHKAQGQQYKNIIVIAESMRFGAEEDIDLNAKWLYTAITRAECGLKIYIGKSYYMNKEYEKDGDFWKAWRYYYKPNN